MITFPICQIKPYPTSKDDSLVCHHCLTLIFHTIHGLFQTSLTLQDALSGDLCDNGEANYILPAFVIFCPCDYIT